MEIPTENQEDIATTMRDNPPSHYTLKVESFFLLSQLVSQIQEKKYESEVSEAEGYKWRLSLHPNGDKERGGDGQISLHLKIVEIQTLPPWMDDSNGKARRFHAMRTEWGFPKLISLEDFNNGCNGFLVGDTCVFGAEVFVINYTGHGDCLSMIKSTGNKFTWKIDKFSTLNVGKIHSNRFTAAQHEWTLVLHPQGFSKGSEENLSIVLELRDPLVGKLASAQFTLVIRDQVKGKHLSRTGAASRITFKTTESGFEKFMPLKDLQDPSKGFLVND